MTQGKYELPEDRFWPKVDFSGDCWEWTASRYRNGYGQFSLYGGIKVLAHRMAYELLVGPIPDGLDIDHRCFNRGCVNPDHLEAVTRAVNNDRAFLGRRKDGNWGDKCVRGHDLDYEIWVNGKRRQRGCRLCGAMRQRKWK